MKTSMAVSLNINNNGIIVILHQLTIDHDYWLRANDTSPYAVLFIVTCNNKLHPLSLIRLRQLINI